MPNENREGNLDVRGLPRATEAEALDGVIFLAPLIGDRQDRFLSLSVESLLQIVSEDRVLSGSNPPEARSGDPARAQIYFRLTSQSVSAIYFSPTGSDRWVETFEDRILSGNIEPADQSGNPMYAQVYFRLTSASISEIYFSPVGSDRWVEFFGDTVLSGSLPPIANSGNPMFAQTYFQLTSVAVSRMWVSPLGSDEWIQAEFGQRPVIAGTTGLTFVPATRVITDVNDRTGGMSLTLDVTGVTQYAEGMGFRFRSGDRNRSEIVRLRLGTSLPYVEILNITGERFGQHEFLPDFLHTIIYDGSNWVALDTVDTPLSIIPAADFTFDATASPNLITIANPDQIVFYEGLAQILFQMEGTNTDDVELSFVPGVSHDVLTSRGEQIPPGYLQNGIFVRAVYDRNRYQGAWISDVEGPHINRGVLLASYTVPVGNYTDGLQPIPGQLVLQGANANVWTDYDSIPFYEGALGADPTIADYGSDGFNFYFNTATERWRRPAGDPPAWQDVADADVGGVLDHRYPSDSMTFQWLGVVADEAAANAAVSNPDDITVTYAAFFDGAVKILVARRNPVGYQVTDIPQSYEDVDKRSELVFPKAHPNENIAGAIVEILKQGTVIARTYSQYGDFGFNRVDVDLDDGTSIGLSGYGGSDYLTLYLSAARNNANVGATDVVQVNIYEWGG